METTRRDILRLSSAALATGLAGCQTSNRDNDPQTPEHTETTTSENHPTDIEFVELHDIETLPIITDDNIDDTAGVRLEVEDQDGLEQIQLLYDNDHRDEPLTLYDKTQDEFEHDAGNQMIPIEEEFPQRLLAPETGEFSISVTDVKGNTETRNQEIHNLTQSWKVDQPQNDNYATERNWDNPHFNRQQFHDEHVSKWHEAAVYDVVLQELENNNQEKYDGDRKGFFYSNSEHKTGNVEGYGHWDKEFYQQLTQLEHILGDAQSAIRTHQKEVHPTAYSAWNNKFAATLEDIANNFNQELQEHQGETGEKALHAGYINEGGHGTVITYTNLEDTDIEAEHPWQFVDTTYRTVEPVTEEIHTGGNYNPFVDGYESDEQLGEYDTTENPDESDVLYRNEKDIATMALLNFIRNGEGDHADIEELEGIATGISDSILENIFNEHVPSGGSIDPILDMVEKTTDLQIDTGKNVHVYGEDLESYQMAVAEDDTLYEMSADPETTVGEEEVENYLADLPA